MGFHHLHAPRAACAAAFALYGGVALIAQLICLQELRLLFLGHELFLGWSLAAWMGWVALGSWTARRLSDDALPWVIAGALPVLLLNLLAIRICHAALEFGLLLGLLPMVGLTAALLAPVGWLLGLAFPLGLARAAAVTRFSAGEAYGWEALGAAAGGLAYSWMLLGRLRLDGMLWGVGGLLAVLLAFATPRAARRLLGLATVLASLLLWSLTDASTVSRRLQWRHYRVIAERTSRYGHLLVARLGSLTALFEDGVLSAHFPDPADTEPIVHLPLLAHPSPARVLIIGGAAAGALQELLKHPVTSVDYLELDPAVIQLLEPALAPADRAALADARVRLIHQDARQWLATHPDRYDVILLHLPEPRNAQINRLYTLEAFQRLREHLTPSGLLALSVPSSENYLSPQTRYFNAAVYRTLLRAFPSLDLATGDQLLLLAGQAVSLDPALLIQRYQQRGLTTRAVVPGTIPWHVDAARRDLVRRQLAAISVPLNRDLSPVCFAYAWRVWLSKFDSPALSLAAAALAGALGVWLLWLWRRRRTVIAMPGPTAMFLLGCGGLTYETVLLLAFQALHGSVYWHLGLLFAAFMAGLAVGAWMVVRVAPSASTALWLRGAMIAMALEGLGVAWWLPGAQQLPPPTPWLLIFAALLLITGGWLGAAFPIATRLSGASDISHAAGMLYAADLWGAALGALATGGCLVPLLGLAPTLGLSGITLLVAALLLPAPTL